jgi:hypothetical protein
VAGHYETRSLALCFLPERRHRSSGGRTLISPVPSQSYPPSEVSYFSDGTSGAVKFPETPTVVLPDPSERASVVHSYTSHLLFLRRLLCVFMLPMLGSLVEHGRSSSHGSSASSQSLASSDGSGAFATSFRSDFTSPAQSDAEPKHALHSVVRRHRLRSASASWPYMTRSESADQQHGVTGGGDPLDSGSTHSRRSSAASDWALQLGVDRMGLGGGPGDPYETLESLANTVQTAATTNASDKARAAFVQSW